MKQKISNLRVFKRPNLSFSISLLMLTQLFWSSLSFGQSKSGASLTHYTQYEAEDATVSGITLMDASTIKTLDFQSEIALVASNQKYTNLTSESSFVQWKINSVCNFVVFRYTLPHSKITPPKDGLLDIYVNESKVKTIELSAHWIKGDMHFDEARLQLPFTLKKGDILKVVPSAGSVVGIDFMLTANAVPLAAPAGFTDVTAYGAIPNDGQNDLAAFNAAYAAATVGVYIPAGTFNFSTIWQPNRNNIKIQGAGITSTTLFFNNAGTMNSGILAVTSGTEISHFYMNTVNTTRDGSPGKGIMGTYGTGSNIHDLEIHHFECGSWIGGYSTPLQVTQNMIFQNNRIIDNWADGINLCQGTSNCTITNNYFSGNLDDGIALWPNNEYGAPMEVNNIISYNTVENNLRAGGIAIFGGNGHQVFNNIVRNSTACSGIRFTTDFPGYHFESTTQIRIYNNTLTNVGCNVDYWGCSRGAIEIDAVNQPIQGLLFENNTIVNSQRHGVQIGSTQSVTNVVFNNLTVNGVGTSGATNSCFTVPIPSCAVMTYGNNGNVTFNNLCIQNVPASQYVYQSNPTGFVLNVSYGCGTSVPVTGVTVSPTSASIALPGTRQLTATVAPTNATDKSVTWTSSNTGVATVNASGLVTGVAAGSATITVRTNNGGFTATCAITVTSTTVPVTGVSVSPTSASIQTGATQTLTATVLPANATDKTVTWTSSNTSVATVNTSGVVTGVAAGNATITVRTNNGGFTATSAITVTSVPQTPFAGNIPIPGVLEAENYDNGGEGVAYHDNETANNGGQYRTGNGVDIEVCSEGGYNVGWIIAGEWLEYTVNVATAGTYTADIRVSTATGGSFHIEFGGVDKTGILTVPNTGGWQNWQSVTRTGMSLSAGVQIMRIYMDGADFNINRITFTGGGTTVPVTGVSVSPTSASIAAGGTSQLTATVSPTNATDKSVTWTSSNTAVATVNASGLVTGVTAGSATITVRTNNGGFTATSAITVTGGGGTLPSPWVSSNIGSVAATGSASYSGTTFTVAGSGADIWGTTDAFRYVYQQVSGDVTITARVASMTNSNAWAKAGVMIRNGLGANVAHALMAVTPSSGVSFQRRTTAGGTSTSTTTTGITAPRWVRLQKVGNTITAYQSANGTTWTTVGSESITMTTIYVGLAVTSHADGSLCTSLFDNVVVTTSTNVPVTGVTMSPTSASIGIGGTTQLTATVQPSNATNKTVSWSSSNTAIATVNTSGLVTGVAAGSATITVTTQSGGFTATCAVTVTGSSITYYRIRNRWQNTYLYDGGDRVYYGTLPANPGLTYEWIFENIATGQVEIRNAGTNEYMHIENLTGYVQCTPRTLGWMSSRWVSASTGDGFVRLQNVWQPSYYQHIENLLGYDQYGTINTAWMSAQWALEVVLKSAEEQSEKHAISDISYMPNPVVSELTIELNGNSFTQLNVYDITGKLCYSEQLDADQVSVLVNMETLKQGIYMVRLSGNQNNQLFKVIKN